jgi:hypothetical protein
MKQFLFMAPILGAFVILAYGQITQQSLVSIPIQHLQTKSKAFVLQADEGEKLEDPRVASSKYLHRLVHNIYRWFFSR